MPDRGWVATSDGCSARDPENVRSKQNYFLYYYFYFNYKILLVLPHYSATLLNNTLYSSLTWFHALSFHSRVINHSEYLPRYSIKLTLNILQIMLNSLILSIDLVPSVIQVAKLFRGNVALGAISVRVNNNQSKLSHST